MFSIKFFTITIVSFLFIDCSKNDTTLIESNNNEVTKEVKSNLIDVSYHYTFKGSILKEIAKKNYPTSINSKFHNVKALKIIYRTFDVNGNYTMASGILLLPETEGDYSLLSFQHGNLLNSDDAPSKSKLGNNDLTFAAIMASTGIITIVPDYLGYGSSSLALHPKEHKNSLATSSYDMLKASKFYIEENHIATNDKLFIAGYSDGGFATIALQQMIEEIGDFSLTKTYAAKGIYNKIIFTESLLNVKDKGLMIGHYLWMINSYNNLYETLNRPWNYYLNEPYAGRLASIQHLNSPIDKKLVTDDVNALFSATFIEGILNKTDTAFLKALDENNVDNWKPNNPIALYLSKNDRPFEVIHSNRMFNSIKSHGGNITMEDVQIENEEAMALPFYLAVLHDILEKQNLE